MYECIIVYVHVLYNSVGVYIWGGWVSVCVWILSRTLSASASFVAIVRVAYIMLCCIMVAPFRLPS